MPGSQDHGTMKTNGQQAIPLDSHFSAFFGQASGMAPDDWPQARALANAVVHAIVTVSNTYCDQAKTARSAPLLGQIFRAVEDDPAYGPHQEVLPLFTANFYRWLGARRHRRMRHPESAPHLHVELYKLIAWAYRAAFGYVARQQHFAAGCSPEELSYVKATLKVRNARFGPIHQAVNGEEVLFSSRLPLSAPSSAVDLNTDDEDGNPLVVMVQKPAQPISLHDAVMLLEDIDGLQAPKVRDAPSTRIVSAAMVAYAMALGDEAHRRPLGSETDDGILMQLVSRWAAPVVGDIEDPTVSELEAVIARINADTVPLMDTGRMTAYERRALLRYVSDGAFPISPATPSMARH